MVTDGENVTGMDNPNTIKLLRTSGPDSRFAKYLGYSPNLTSNILHSKQQKDKDFGFKPLVNFRLLVGGHSFAANPCSLSSQFERSRD